LIHRYGTFGAACAVTLAAGITTLVYRRAICELIALHDLKHSIKPLIAATAMGIVLFFINGANLFILITTGVLVYSLVLVAIKGLTSEDIGYIRGLYPRATNKNET
jgi:O-antigen/teichoic acid export membrane protein